jgi:hypothetical protein
VIEFVLPVDKLFKLEFLHKIYLLVVVQVVVMDAMVDIHQALGIISKELVLLLDGSIILLIIVDHIVSLHVIIILLVDINHVVLHNQPQNVKDNVLLDIVEAIQLINGLLIQYMLYHHKLLKFKLKL